MELNKQAAGMPEIGYWLNFSPKSGAVRHEFCGLNTVAGALCPNCDKPLLKVASFSATDPVLILDPTRISSLPLLYCWTCAIPYGEFRYKIFSDGTVKILTFLESYDGAFGPEGPYEGYRGFFPAKEMSLNPQSPAEQRSLALRYEDNEVDLADELARPRHQIGGFPMIYNPQSEKCPECGAEMPVFASIADNTQGNEEETEPENSFVDNSGVQTVFLFCRKCSVVSVYHSCD